MNPSSPSTSVDSDASPPAKRPRLGPITKHFFSAREKIEKDVKFILKEAPEIDCVGIKYNFGRVLFYQGKRDEASKNADWDSAIFYEDQYNMYYNLASHELALIESCTWALGHATSEITRFRQKRQFKECKKMGELNDVAQAFLDCVGQADLDFVQRLKDEGGSWEKALQPAGSTENALQVEPPPTIDVQLEPPLTRDVQLEPPPTNVVSNLFVSLLARRA